LGDSFIQDGVDSSDPEDPEGGATMGEGEPESSVEDTGELSDASVEDTSVEDASVEDASVEDASVEDASVEDASVEDASVEDTSVEDTSVEDASVEDTGEVSVSVSPAGGLSVTELFKSD
jgi:HAE1 family hydrophobic/amphiphilic exporter-1